MHSNLNTSRACAHIEWDVIKPLKPNITIEPIAVYSGVEIRF